MPKISAFPAKGWVRETAMLGTGIVPFGRTKLREEVAAGRFPKPKKFSERVVAYDAEAVLAWIDAQRETAAA